MYRGWRWRAGAGLSPLLHLCLIRKNGMNLHEYLSAKYGMRVPTTITSAEADIFGVGYPLTFDWLARNAHIEITQHMRAELIAALRVTAGRACSRGLWAERGLVALGLDAAEVNAEAERVRAAIREGEALAAKIRADRAAARAARSALGGEVKTLTRKQRKKQEKTAKQLQRQIDQADAGKSERKPRPPRQQRQPRVPRAPRMEKSSAYGCDPALNVEIARRRTEKFVETSAVDPASDDFLRSREWAYVRMQAIEKFKRRGQLYCHCCMAVAAPGKPLHVDHIKPRKFFPSLALDIENLEMLCDICNLGKANQFMTDWRPRSADATNTTQPQQTVVHSNPRNSHITAMAQ